MNYESIAELVHDLVKNPKRILSRELGLPSTELKNSELTIIRGVFSKYEASGSALSIGVIPQGMWG